MGQSVRTLSKVGDSSRIKADKNEHKKEQGADVTQLLVGQNSDNSSTSVLLLSDEPSMSSIVDTQTSDNSANNNSNNLGSGNISTRLFSKRPWIGCQSLPLSDSRSRFIASSTSIVTATVIKGGEGGDVIVGEGGGTKTISNNRIRSSFSKTRLRKSSSSILNDISFGSLLVDKKKSSFKDIQEQQGIQKFISLVANSSSHAKTQSDDATTCTIRATNTATTTTTNSPEMEQLITMMKNHKVSEGKEDRINNNKHTQSSAPTRRIIPFNNTEIDPSDPKYAYLKNRKILPMPKPRLKKSTVGNSTQITSLSSSSSSSSSDNSMFKEDSHLMDQNDRENSKKMRHSISPSTSITHDDKPRYYNILNNTSSFNFSMDKLKQLPHEHQQKALDPITIKLDLDKSKNTVNVSGKSNNDHTNKLKKPTPSSALASKVASPDTKLTTNTANNKQPKRSSNSKKKKKGRLAVQSPPPPLSSVNTTDESSFTVQHEPSTAVTTTRKGGGNHKKGQRHQQKKRWDDDFSTAPGGFLSSDITLFDNPISDDWICLFCQYEVLCHGLEATKRKNGYYRRKRERLQREASRRFMHHEPSDSDDELIFKDERPIRT